MLACGELPISPGDPFEALAVALVDLRATSGAIRRAVTNAQASVEQHRHKPNQETLADIADCLEHIAKDAQAVIEVTDDAKKALQDVIGQSVPSS